MRAAAGLASLCLALIVAVVVYVNDVEAGRGAVEPGERFRWEFLLPRPAGAGSFPNVRLRSTDYAYHGQDLRQAAAIRLERIALH